MNMIEKTEQQFGFKYPDLYVELYNDKMLEASKESRNTLEADFTKAKNNPTLLLFAQDFTLMNDQEIEDESKNLRNPDDYRSPDPKHQFIPFAWTKSGHCYAFCFEHKKGNDVPIVLVYNNMDEALFLAKNLQDFIFRYLLETVSDVADGMPVTQGDFYENISNLLRTHKKYLTDQQQVTVEIYYKKKLQTFTNQISPNYEQTRNGLISFHDLKTVLADEIGFEQLDQTFLYMLS